MKIFNKKSQFVNFTLWGIIAARIITPTRAWAAPVTWSGGEDEPAHFYDLEVVFQNFLGVFVAFASVVVFFMLIVAGYRFMFSGGDPQKNAQAKATMTWAVIGLVLLLGIWLIFVFIKEFTGVDASIFCIPGPEGKVC